jgi:hypothetical protein
MEEIVSNFGAERGNSARKCGFGSEIERAPYKFIALK